MPAPTTEMRRTACNRDCPDACSLLVRVVDGRAIALRGDPDDDVTAGFLCERTGRFLARQHAPDRFLVPHVRRSGRLVPASWDEALDLVAERLTGIRETSGPASVLHYRSGGSLGILKALADRLFEHFGPVTVKRGDICSGAGEAAQERDFGLCRSHDRFDVLNSRTILLWGRNPHTSSVHLLPVLKEARRRGATVVGVDPIATRATALCDLFLQPRPGGDFALAMGVARVLFDEGWIAGDAGARCDHLPAYRALAERRDVAGWAALADVTETDVRRAAEHYGTERPAAILVGWGLARRRHGAAAVRALDALGAVSGNLGVAGGGVSYSAARQAPFDTEAIASGAAARTLAEARLGHEILAADDPPVRAVWVTAGNPVSMLPDAGTVRRAFERIEFVVVVDTHPTDTTDVADVVLPTLTLLEDSDVLGSYGHHWLRVSTPAVDPPPGPRHELEILHGLAERLGLGDVLAGDVDHWKRVATRSLEAAGAGADRLAEGARRDPGAPAVLFADGRVPTPSGRVDLVHEEPPPPAAPDADWPLLLLASSTPKAQSSQWSVDLGDEPASVSVHPTAAAGVPDGARARLASRLGTLEVRVVHDERVRPDVALMSKGGMQRDGRCANVLVEAEETDAGGGAVYYDQPVRLEAVD